MNPIDITNPEQQIKGPGRLVLILDATEIFPDDPGMGTPMLFKYLSDGETMTWTCGYEGGNLGDIVPPNFADHALEWAESIADQVNAWETYHWDKASRKIKENTP